MRGCPNAHGSDISLSPLTLLPDHERYSGRTLRASLRNIVPLSCQEDKPFLFLGLMLASVECSNVLLLLLFSHEEMKNET